MISCLAHASLLVAVNPITKHNLAPVGKRDTKPQDAADDRVRDRPISHEDHSIA